ncbi:MAG: diguanylate cyclase [Porticoccaceae bacterium]|nr:diguanylate cyclase [Porticoccaceae bacterium]
MTATLGDNSLGFIIDRVDVGILVVTENLEVVLWNRFMEANSKMAAESIVGKNLLESFPDLPGKWLEKKVRSVQLLNNFAFTSWQQRPYLFHFKHHRPITGGVTHMYQNCTFIPFEGSDGESLVCITLFDVTDTAISHREVQQAHADLEELSHRDPLTGVYNRRYMEAELDKEFQRVARYGGKLSVLFLDLDFFKKVNDTYGHQAGDQVLIEVTQRISSIVRATDCLARYGGEEFAIMLPETDTSGGLVFANRVREAIEKTPVQYEEHVIAVTASLGLSEYVEGTENYDTLLDQSDKALYVAKKQGRNRVVCFLPDM